MCVGIETIRWIERRLGYQEGYDQAEKDIIQLMRDEIERRIRENRVACISDFNDLISFLDELEKE